MKAPLPFKARHAAGVLCGIWALTIHVQGASGGPQSFNYYTAEQLPLAPKAREYIARIEQKALLINSKAFPTIAQAIKDQDGKGLTHFLSAGFQGTILNSKKARTIQSAVLSVQRADSQEAAEVDGRQFVNYLLERRARFAKDVKVKLSLISLQPKEAGKLEGTGWRGNCLLELRGSSTNGFVAETFSGVEFELRDIPELEEVCALGKWIETMRLIDLQESFARRPFFREVAKERGIDRAKFADTWTIFPPGSRPVVTGGVYLGDINNDDYEDILVTDVKGVFLYEGTAGGKFKDITQASGLPGNLPPAANAAFGDFDNDGFLDLILDFRAFRNDQGTRFVEVTARTGLRLGTSTGLTVVDYDGDGLLDLYLTRSYGVNVPRNMTNSWIDGAGGPGNQLWRNLGDWKFQNVTRVANAAAGRMSCFTAAWLDANNDGWPDAYAINEFGGGALLVNTGQGSFRAQPLIDDVGDFGSMGLAVGDYNNDGWIDVYAANMFSKSGRRVMENLPEGSYDARIMAKMKRFVTGSEMYLNDGGLKFTRGGHALGVHRVGWSYGPAFIDLDNDGFLDVYGTAGFSSVNREEPDG